MCVFPEHSLSGSILFQLFYVGVSKALSEWEHLIPLIGQGGYALTGNLVSGRVSLIE